jgi:hypothetical protein
MLSGVFGNPIGDLAGLPVKFEPDGDDFFTGVAVRKGIFL